VDFFRRRRIGAMIRMELIHGSREECRLRQRFVSIGVLAVLNISFVCGQVQQDKKDSTIAASTRIFPLPIFFYTPETGFAGGAAALLIYRDPASPRASSVTADVIYTQKKQIVFELNGDQYFVQGRFRLLSELKMAKYPNKFYGIGNSTPSSNEEEYTPRRFLLKTSLSTNIISRFNAGPIIRYESVTMNETDPTGQLAGGMITGGSGGISSGAGFVANWDSRDNTFAAYEGSFYQVTALFYQKVLGGDYSYSDIQLDLRQFYETAPGHVVALQAAGEFMGGTIPFQNLARFGGQNLLRGYFDGRYRDKHGVALQAEYRLPVWGRLGLVGFAGVAQVANQLDHFGLKNFWFAGGAGLRFAWNPEERVNLRLDFGFGNNSDGIYITVIEAF
jgi:hypothetical protein